MHNQNEALLIADGVLLVPDTFELEEPHLHQQVRFELEKDR